MREREPDVICSPAPMLRNAAKGNTVPTVTAQAMADRLGTEQVSDWVEVGQEMIDEFADATGDHQFIHVDPQMAAMTPFGGTVAHGFLTLSLMPPLSPKIADAVTRA